MTFDSEYKGSSVAVFHIPIIDDVKCTNIKNWYIKELDEQDAILRGVKSGIDYHYKKNPKRWEYTTRAYEPSYHISRRVRDYSPIVTNAWLKIYELVRCFDKHIFKDGMKTLTYFDNASMPGIFPYAVNHYMRSYHPDIAYNWYASSLIEPNKLDDAPLMDVYGLWENYPNRWLMNKKYNGDVMSIDVQMYFKDKLGGTVDLYTSDIGFDVSRDYNEQETLQSPVNLGQIISGLITLKVGGVLITKQYTYVKCFTVSLMGILTRMFDKLYITKPLSSKPDNSETYIVGVGYKGCDDEMITYLLNLLKSASVITPDDKIVPMKPIIQKKCINDKFITAVINSNKYFMSMSASKVTQNLHDYVSDDRSNTRTRQNNINHQVDKWFMLNPIKLIAPEYQLRTSVQKKYKQVRNNKVNPRGRH